MKSPRQIKRHAKKIRIEPDAVVDERVLTLAETALAKSTKDQAAVLPRRPPIRRTIMKGPITKLAAAAAIIIVVLIGIHQIGGSTPAFAEIVRPFLTARTATFKATVSVQGGPSQTGEGMFMEPGRMRQISEDGTTVISDLHQGKMVALIPTLNRAIVYELVNIPEDPGELNIFMEIRRRILEAQELDDECVEFLGKKEIEGQTAIGYHVQKPGLDITIWADAKTLLPIRMENTTGPTTYAMSDIIFDVELDTSLFNLQIPEEYTVHTLQMDGSEPEEKDLIEMFRIWAEHTDGSLPSTLDMSAPMEFVNAQRKKMMKGGQEPSEQEMMEKIMEMQQTIMNMSRGGMFVQQLPANSDWHYAGKDVKFGDADTPIFWYRPEGSETYRVIYADLSVIEVSSDEAPKSPEAEPASKNTSEGKALVDKAIAKAIAMGADVPTEKRDIVARMLSLNEKDLIPGLRAFAEFSGGRYPSKLDPKTAIKETHTLGPKLTEIPKSQRQAKVQDIFFAATYYDKLVRQKKNVAYYGDKVTAKDSDKVLIRWEIGEDKYRVIYGDLSVKDVTPENLPK